MTACIGAAAGRLDVRRAAIPDVSAAEGAEMAASAGIDCRRTAPAGAPDASERPRR